MKISEHLFFLVKSLTQNEKRFFRISSNFQSGKGKEKVYIKMFDVIDKMEVVMDKGEKKYDERLLLELFKGNKKKLSVNKIFLYDKILKNLRAYNETNAPINMELFNLISEVRLLMEKGLFPLALKRLKKAKKMAIQSEKLTILLEIIDIEIDLQGQVKNKDIEATFQQLFDEATDTLNKLIQITEVKHLSRDLYNAISLKKHKEINGVHCDKMKKISESADKLASFHAKSYYYRVLGYYNYILKDFKQSNKHFQEGVELWTDHEIIRKTDNQRYRIYLSNYGNSCLVSENYASLPTTIEQIRNVPAKSNYEKASTFQNASHLELLYYMKGNKYQQALNLVPDIEKNIDKYRDFIGKSREVSFYYNITVAFFALKKYEEAGQWLNRIIYDNKSEPGGHIKRFAWILEVILHHERNNDGVLRYIFSSSQLPNDSEAYPFESMALEHLKKIIFTVGRRKKLYENFREDLNSFQNKQPFGLDELSTWVESKITHKSFIEIRKGKSLNK